MLIFFFRISLLITHLVLSQAKINTEPIVELRWDFTDCGKTGRTGPTQNDCDRSYRDTNLENDVTVTNGIQTWKAPISGLYLVEARGASGLSAVGKSAGRGAVTISDFRINKGEKLNILIGQRSSYDITNRKNRGPGGSGGTFVVRESDGYILMVAGGGSSSAGEIPDRSKRFFADANSNVNGKNGSKTSGVYGLGGLNGQGGFRGFLESGQISTSGGGAGYYSNGNFSFIKTGYLLEVESPKPSIRYATKGVSEYASGVGGYFMYISNGKTQENNGGFGGGGSGSLNGGAGGGGGYSGGGGGPWNGWGGGGGSINNGERSMPTTLHDGLGSVSITFTGYACCGPIAVYIALCFVAGILTTVLIIFSIYVIYIWIKATKRRSSEQDQCIQRKKGFYSVFKFHSNLKINKKKNNSCNASTASWRTDNL